MRKKNLKKILIMFAGSILALLGLFWFLQGTAIIKVCPILCFADCECLTDGSLVWEIIGLIAFFIGICATYLGFRGNKEIKKFKK
jgi:hypothetical protein